MTSLTDQAARRLAVYLSAGDVVIDATAGNGYDTLFLAQHVEPAGHVFAFDIQPRAIEKTRQRLAAQNLAAQVTLRLASHGDLKANIPLQFHRNISVIMFNLGYLPGSDKSVKTETSTTLAALEDAIALLKPDGLLSVMLYPGHAGGETETLAVLNWANTLPAQWQTTHVTTAGPQWLLIQKTLSASASIEYDY